MSRSAHFIDPLLRAILETSLTPDDDDLFSTNIINKPVLVVHGFVLCGRSRPRLMLMFLLGEMTIMYPCGMAESRTVLSRPGPGSTESLLISRTWSLSPATELAPQEH